MKKLSFLLTLLIPVFTFSQIINIPADYPTIQLGIDVANTGDTVLVDTGTYFENINFIGKAITVASHYIIDGDTNHINNTVINGSQPAIPDSASVVTFNSGTDTTSVICGFTITGGTGTSLNSDTWRLGGGILCYYAGAKIINNKILNNTTHHPDLAHGGGICCRSSNQWVVIRDNTIQHNAAFSDSVARGGGIYSRNNSLVLKNNIISHDSLYGDKVNGGGVYLYFTYYLEMTGNIITRNSVVGISDYWGVGMLCITPRGPVKISQNEFSNNIGEYQGYGGGGGLYIGRTFNYPVEIDRNRFLNNTAQYGGGLYEVSCYNMRVTNNVFKGNVGMYGGAVGVYHSEDISSEYLPQTINNTFLHNSAVFGSAIMFMANFTGSPPVIMNCIFWENAGDPWNEEITSEASDTIFIYNSDINTDHIFGLWYGKHNFSADPEFDTDSIHLLGSSPCINAGIDSLKINGIYFYCPDHDIDGDARPLNIVVDVGADEKLHVGIPEIMNDELALKVYPNPFTSSTTITYNLPQPSTVQLRIFNHLGKQVEYIQQNQFQGEQQISWDASGLPAGMYYFRFEAGEQIATGKLLLVR